MDLYVELYIVFHLLHDSMVLMFKEGRNYLGIIHNSKRKGLHMNSPRYIQGSSLNRGVFSLLVF